MTTCPSTNWSPCSFSFNSPSGACPECTGLGAKLEVDAELIVPDESKSLEEGVIAPWSGGHTSDYFVRLAEALGRTFGFTIDTPWSKLPAAARQALLHGHGQPGKSPVHDPERSAALVPRPLRGRDRIR